MRNTWMWLISFLLIVPASAAGARPSSPNPLAGTIARLERSHVSLSRIVILRPSPESEMKKDFKVLEFSDGSRAVVAGSKPDVAAPRLYGQPFMWSVDLDRGLYTVKKTALNERDLDLVRRVRERNAREESAARLRRQSETFDDGGESGTGYSYMHAAETWELGAFFGAAPLTRTEAEIDWSQCGTQLTHLQLDGFLPNCWANADTFVHTHWSTTGCTPYEPPDTGYQLSGSIEGSYINWNFMDSSQATYAFQAVHVIANSGGDAYGWVYQYQYGEFSSILVGREFPGSVYTRPSSCYSSGGGGGGGGGDDGGGGSGDPGGGGDSGGGGGACVPVYDGSNGDYLGDCCGATTDEIISCAEGYL